MCGIFIIKFKRNPNKYLNQFKTSLNNLYSRGPDSEKFKEKSYHKFLWRIFVLTKIFEQN